MNWDDINALSAVCGERLVAKNLTLATAESCTGGGIGYALTAISGSSAWYLGGAVAYANQIKTQQLGVTKELLTRFGAVSNEVALAMAAGASGAYGAKVAVSTSGIAGPDGGSAEKPVGTVCFGWVIESHQWSETCLFEGDREAVRLKSIQHALKTLVKRL